MHSGARTHSVPAEVTRKIWPPMARYELAVLAVAGAFSLRLALDPLIGKELQPFATFYVAVACVAWWFGRGPGVLAQILGLVTSLWFVIPPRSSLRIRGFADGVEIVLYLLVTSTVVALMHSLHRAREEARASAALANQRKAELEADNLERRRVEERLRRSEESLEQKVRERTVELQESMHELEHVSYSITHDMRAPLRAIGNYADIIQEETQNNLTPDHIEYFRRIRSSARRMDKLIEDMLAYTRIIHRTLPLEPVELAGLLRDLIDTYPNLQAPGVRIQVEFERLMVLANEAGLTECFSNLLGNAVKFVAPGVAPEVRLQVDRRGGVARIKVMDNGIGIPPHARERIFRMFQRLHGLEEYGGTGAGLSIVRKTVERMKGRVGLESEVGKGSCFWVELPLATNGSMKKERESLLQQTIVHE